MTDKLVLSVEEAAAALGIGRTTAWRMVRTGALPVLRCGRRVLVPREGLEEWVRQQVK